MVLQVFNSCLVVLVVFIFILGVCYIFHPYSLNNNKNKNNYIESFISQRQNNDPDLDGKMSFNYLTNPDYKNNILARYYLDDDIKINGSRLVEHPGQVKNDCYKILLNRQRQNVKCYGSRDNININNSNDIYANYGIRI